MYVPAELNPEVNDTAPFSNGAFFIGYLWQFTYRFHFLVVR